MEHKDAARAIDRNNALSVILMGALPPVAGSAISFLLAAFIVWGVISVAAGRVAFRLSPSDRQVAGTFTLFAAVILFAGMIGKDRTDLPAAAYWLLPFLGLWVLIPRLRASPHLDYLGLFVKGATIGCLAALVLAILELTILGKARAEGGAGNTIIFGIMCLCLSAVAGLGIPRGDRSLSLVNLMAVAAGLGALVLSLSRGVILVAPAIAVCLILYLRPTLRLSRASSAIILAFFAVTVIALAFSNVVEDRILATLFEIEQLSSEGHSSSIGERLRLWAATMHAFLESPIWGYGIQNRMDAILPKLIADGQSIFLFTHPHNGILTMALDGGILAVAAVLLLLATPILVAWRAPRDGRYRKRLFLAIMLSLSYLLVGMTQIMFKHDIMDSFFIFTATIIAASVPMPQNLGDRDVAQ